MTENIGTAAGSIDLDLTPLRRSVQAANRPLKNLEQAMERAGKASSNSSRLLNMPRQSLDRASASAQQTTTRLRATSQQLAATSTSAQQSSQGMARLGAAMNGLPLTMVAGGIGALSVALGGLLAASVSTAAGFEQAMARLGAVSQATEDQLAELEAVAKDLGSTTVFSARQAANGMNFLAMAGFEVNEVIAAMPGVLDLAAAGQMDLARTSDIASNILSGFRLEANQMGRVSDVLAATMTSANTNIEQLGYAMSYAAPLAADMGVSIEGASAAIGRLSDAGIQGERAGTSLRAILMALSAPTDEAREELDALGVEVTDAADEFRSLPDIISQFEERLAGMTSVQRSAALSTIFGNQHIGAFNVLLAEGGEALQDYTTELEGAGGAAARLAGQQMATFQGAMTELQSSLEGVGIEVGQELLPVLTEMAREVFIPFVRTYGPLLVDLTGDFANGLALVYLELKPLIDYMMISGVPAMETFIAGLRHGPDAAVDAAANAFRRQADMLVEQNEHWERGAAALDAYNQSSEETQERLREEAQQFEATRARLRDHIALSQLRLATGEISQEQYDAEIETVNRHINALSKQGSALADQVVSLEEAAATSEEAADAARELGLETRFSADEIEAMNEALEEAYTQGLRAFRDAVQTEVDFLSEREDARRSHMEQMADITADGEERRLRVQEGLADAEERFQRDTAENQARMAEELAEAETETERQAAYNRHNERQAAIDERIIQAREANAEALQDLEAANQAQLEAQQEAFAEQERQAAEAYARQQAQQLAHLGQELINYVTVQAEKNGVSDERLTEMTDGIRAEFGVQQSLMDRSYRDFMGMADSWAENNGENTDAYIEQMRGVRGSAVETQREVNAKIDQLTREATAAFHREEIGPVEYAQRLSEIPGEAEAAVGATTTELEKLPTELETDHEVRSSAAADTQAITEQINTIPREVTTIHRIKQEAEAQKKTLAGGGLESLAVAAIGARAAGGPVQPRKIYRGNELGQELFVPRVPGTVLPANVSARVLQAMAAPSAPAQMPAPSQSTVLNVGGLHVVVHNPVVDTAERVEQVSDTIVERSIGAFSRLIEGEVQVGV